LSVALPAPDTSIGSRAASTVAHLLERVPVASAWDLVAAEVRQTRTYRDAYLIGYLQQRVHAAGRSAERADRLE